MALALLRTPIRVTEVSKEHHLLTKQNPSLPGSVVTSSTLVEGADCGYCDLLLVSLCLLVNMLLGLPYGNIEKNYEEERIIISTKDPDIQNLIASNKASKMSGVVCRRQTCCVLRNGSDDWWDLDALLFVVLMLIILVKFCLGRLVHFLRLTSTGKKKCVMRQ